MGGFAKCRSDAFTQNKALIPDPDKTPWHHYAATLTHLERLVDLQTWQRYVIPWALAGSGATQDHESLRESCRDHHLSGSPVATGRRTTNALRTKRRGSHPTIILMRMNCVTQVRFNNQIAIIRKYESECG